jgi:DNA mismatch endonuclease (patch repair protein)
MSRIRSKNTHLEDKFEEILVKAGLNYEKQSEIIGKPDFVLPEYKVALFADSHFWHGYHWNETKKQIKSNRDFWIPKIERNIQRDKEVNAALRGLGWQVIRCWEHEIKDNPEKCFRKIKKAIDIVKGEK